MSYAESKEFHAALEEYITNVSSAENEAAKATRFYMFLPQIYKGIKPEYADKVFRELKIEKSVVDTAVSKGKTIIIRGRIDSTLGNVIFEFEKNLSKTHEEALEQLKQYTAALWNSQKHRVSYTCMATDGILFYPYRPYTEVPEGEKVSAEDITLDGQEAINLGKIDPVDSYFWFDRYLLATPILEPSVEQIANDFGSKGPVFLEMIQGLRQIWKEAAKYPYVKVPFDQWDKYLTIVYGSKVGDEELFLRHTYLATLAKLLVYGYFSEGALPTSEQEITRVLNGNAFKEWQVHNFLEEDFFAWIVRGKTKRAGLNFARKLTKYIARYNLDSIDQDMLREVYQELVDPETRKGLGEFYTPEWLTELLLTPLVRKNPNGSMLDPACGSGTFLFTAIKLKKAYITDVKGQFLLKQILETVQGIDVHPLAVIISKANYLLALGKLLKGSRCRVSISIPVYLSNSIRHPKREMDPSAIIPTYRFEAYKKILEIPEVVAEDPTKMDAVIDLINEFAVDIATSGGQFIFSEEFLGKLLQKRVPDFDKLARNQRIVKTLFQTAGLLKKLIEDEEDTIWAFIIKNYYKPLFLRERKFDYVVGNPPWLTYKGIAEPSYQKFVKNLTVNVYGLAKGSGAGLITHMEQATLFMLRCAEFYLRDGGILAFVMPRSIFSADHHDIFRRQAFIPRVELEFRIIYDFKKVKPLFGMPACAIVAKKGRKTKYPVNCVKLQGTMLAKNVGWEAASKELTKRKTSLALSYLGKRSALTPKKLSVDFRNTRSYYFDRFRQGASIVPRSLFFIEFQSGGKFGVNADFPKIKTSLRAMNRAKKQYEDVEIEGSVEHEYLYNAITGSELLPFGHMPYLPIILPVEKIKGKLRIITAKEAKSQAIEGLYKWFKEAEDVWKTVRGKKSGYSLYDWLDYENKLTGQNLNSSYRVVFPGPSSTYLVSAVLPHEKLSAKVEGVTIPFKGLVIDHACLQYETENEEEAYYVCAMLNSKSIDRIIKPFQSTGQGGEQNIHKKPLEIPIPKFNEKNKIHKEISQIGKECSNLVEAAIPDFPSDFQGVGRLRQLVKEKIAPQLIEIDKLAKQILSEEKRNHRTL